jgi:hypothetical protein
MSKMHHFMIEEDATGAWDFATIKYLGEIDRAEHAAKKDADGVHYDQHDGDALDKRFWQVAGVAATSANVAITMVSK